MKVDFTSVTGLTWQGQRANHCPMDSTPDQTNRASLVPFGAEEARGTSANRRLPRHVYVKKAKGHSYLYYRTGEKNEHDRYKHVRLPNLNDPGFAEALSEAKLIRWRASRLTLSPMPLMLAAPTGDDLYFVRAADAVKIGRTVDVWNRLKKMQADNHLELRCVCRLPNRGREEKDWHSRFAHLRIRGEWFRWMPEIADAIIEARAEYGDAPNLSPIYPRPSLP